MRQTKIIMGMPITVEIDSAPQKIFSQIFNYFRGVDLRFSTFKENSEISKINKGEISKSKFSPEVKEVFKLANRTKRETNGYFNIVHNGHIDPSGIVKGWAILNAAFIIKSKGLENFYIDAGGDIEAMGLNSQKKKWRVGIKNPFNSNEVVKVVELSDRGIATSGNYIRGEHIYNPISTKIQKEIVSMTVIGKNIYEADRFATAAFAMGRKGIYFIENLKDIEGYVIDKDGIAIETSGFKKYLINHA